MSGAGLPPAAPRRPSPGWSKELVRTLLESFVVVGLLLTAYALLPLNESGSWSFVLKLIGATLLTVAVLAYQVRMVSRADFPALRAARALLTSVALFLLCFAGGYLSLSHANSGSFNAPLNRVDAVYFTVTVFATVGFGDIVAVSQAARIIVSVQMLLNLAFLGAGLRLLVNAARVRLSQRPAAPPDDRSPDPGAAGPGGVTPNESA